MFLIASCAFEFLISISGLVVEYIVVIDVTRLDSQLMHLACSQRLCCVTAEMFDISWSIIKERSHVEKNYWQTRFRKKDMIAKGKWQYFSAAVAEPSVEDSRLNSSIASIAQLVRA